MGNKPETGERSVKAIAAKEDLRSGTTVVNSIKNGCNGVIIIQNGLVRFASDKITGLTGIPLDAILNKPFASFIAPEHVSTVVKWYRRKMAGEQVPDQYEIEILSREGTTIPVELNINIIELEGKTTGLVLIRDITAEKKAEQELAASEARYRLLYENSYDAIMMGTPDGRILSANLAACRMFGMTEKELCQASRNALTDVSDPRLTSFLEERSRTGDARSELVFIRKDGTRFTGEIASHVYIDSEGQTRTSTIIRDVSGRKHAQEIINAERENFRNSLEASPFGVQVLTYNGDLIYSNRTMLDMWGCKNIEEERAIPLENKFSPESIPLIKDLNRQRRPGDTIRHYELTAIDKLGRRHILQATSKEITWDGEKAIEVIYQDITEQKRTEEILNVERENYRSSLQTLPFGVQIINSAGQSVYINRTMLNMWGYDTVEELSKLTLEQVFTPESTTLVRYLYSQRQVGKVPPPHDLTLICKDGQIRHVHVNASEIY